MKLLRLLPWMAGLLLFGYVASRAWLISFTHDEGFTYQHFLYPGIADLLTYAYPVPNHHLLNTLAVRFLADNFPLNDFLLRVPNILMYLVYLLFSWKITRDFTSAPWRITAFLFLNSIPYMLDFFSMARGYGMSYGFLMGSLYYIKLWFRDRSPGKLALTLVFGALAVLAVFVVINFYLALCGVIFLAELARNYNGFFRKSWKTLLLLALISIPLVTYTVIVSFKFKEAGQLFAGTDAGFWQGTVRSLVTRILYRDTSVGGLLFGIASFLIGTVIAGGVLHFLRLNRGAPVKIDFLSGIVLILMIMEMGLVIQHYALDVLYLLDRTALFLVIPFLVLVVEFFRTRLWSFTWGRALFGLVAGASLLNFFLHANFSYFLETKYDANTKRALQDLAEYRKGRDFDELKGLYVYWVYHPSASFYQNAGNYGSMKQIERYGTFDSTYEYYYIPDSILYHFKHKPYTILKRYPLTLSVLVKNHSPSRKTIYARKYTRFAAVDPADGNAVTLDGIHRFGKQAFAVDTAKFSPSLEFDPSVLPPERLYRVEVSSEMYFPEQPAGNMVVSVKTRKDSLVLWTGKQLENMALSTGKWAHVSFIQNLPAFLPDEKYTISVHIWNRGSTPVFFSKLEAVIVDQPDYGPIKNEE